MKKFIVAIMIMIGIVFVGYNAYSTIESAYDYVPEKPCIYILNSNMELIRFANYNEEVPTYMLPVRNGTHFGPKTK